MPEKTPAQRRADAAELERQADLHEQQAKLARAAATGLRAIADLEEHGLTSEDRLNTIDGVNASPSSNSLRAKKQLDANPDHKFVAMLKREHLTVPEVALALTERLKRQVPRNTVQSWYKKTGDTGFRRIPIDAAEALEALYGLPVDSWPRRAPAKK